MKTGYLKAASALAAMLTAASALAGTAPETLITHVRLFDGERTEADRDILIRDGRIAAVGQGGALAARASRDGARSVDGRGQTLLPGLIDAHVHAYQGLDDPLMFGVTTQLDMFMPPEGAKPVKARMAAGTNTGAADLFTAGNLATVPGGHGTEFGVPVPTLTKPEEADAWVVARIAEGSDYIKLVEEPGTAIHHPLPTLDAATFKALVAAAHRRGKLAVAHVEDRASAEMAVNAGIDGLMHLFIDQDGGAEFARLAAAHHIFVTPTYVVFEGFSTRSGGTELLTHSNFGQWLGPQAQNAISRPAGRYPAERLDGLMKGNIQALRAAHVPILAGTDAGNPGTWYGASLHRELELLVKAGLTPSESLTAATAAPAKAFHLTDRGRIAPGLKADLLLVEGDPTVDILATRHIVEIWKDGVSANALREERRLALANPVKAPEAAALALPADGVIGHAVEQGGKADFSAPFGQWGLTTDAIAGGKSTAAAALGAVTPEGAPSLAVNGELRADFAFPWAGVIFYPGAQPFTPANLSNAARVTFRVRGTPGEYMVMGFSEPSGPRPVMRPFTVGADWREVSVAFSDLAGFDSRQTQGLAIAATGAARAFKLEISEVKLVK